MPQIIILCHHVKPSVTEMGYILLSHCLNEPHSNHETSQTIAKISGYCPQHEDKPLFLNTALICVIKLMYN